MNDPLRPLVSRYKLLSGQSLNMLPYLKPLSWPSSLRIIAAENYKSVEIAINDHLECQGMITSMVNVHFIAVEHCPIRPGLHRATRHTDTPPSNNGFTKGS